MAGKMCLGSSRLIPVFLQCRDDSNACFFIAFFYKLLCGLIRVITMYTAWHTSGGYYFYHVKPVMLGRLWGTWKLANSIHKKVFVNALLLRSIRWVQGCLLSTISLLCDLAGKYSQEGQPPSQNSCHWGRTLRSGRVTGIFSSYWKSSG